MKNRYWLILYIALIILRSDSLGAQHRLSTDQDMSEDFAKRATAVLKGTVIWERQDLSQTTVQVYKDQNLRSLYTGVTQLEGGEFEIRVEPGKYYLVAFVDLNHSGKFDIGDGMGIFGITDWNDSNQQKQAVQVTDRRTIRWLQIVITARMQEVDGKGQVVSMRDYRSNPLEQFKQELVMISSGIRGQVSYEERERSKDMLVFAYTDLSWKYRAAEARVEADGSFTLNLKPGKYYLMAIVDDNDTNRFDPGDELGIYGVDDLRSRQAFPQPVLVKRNQFKQDVLIAITGKQAENGRVIPLDTSVTEMGTSGTPVVKLSGEVRWDGHPLKGSIIQVYREPTLLKEIKQVGVDEDGKFRLQIPPGDYYFMANVDADGDGRYSPGDALGGYGSTNITTTPPSALTVAAKTSPEIEIFVTARYDTEGQLEAIIQGAGDLALDIDSGISGEIRWDGKEFKEGILSISETPDFQSPVAIPLDLAEAERYKVSIPPGDYYIMVVVDLDGNRKAGMRDGVGVYGTRHPVRGEPQKVSVFAGNITPHIDIEIFSMYIDTKGNIAEIEDGHRSEIKLQYGSPEDIFKFTRFGRQIEEWWYWRQGIGFSFEAVGAGWKLQNRKDFEPNVLDPEQLKQLESFANQTTNEAQDAQLEPETTSLNALIYYSYDNVIWSYAPNGLPQPMGAGTSPTASRNGTLTYMNAEGDIVVHDSDVPEGRLLLDRRELATDVMISPDGAYVSFARRSMDRRRVYIRHIPSQEEIVVPSTAKEMFTPTWNLSGELLAYSTRGSIENPESGTDRNIYTYDQVTKRIEPICIGEADDAEPAWSPSNPNLLAFSRAEDRHRQIWTVTFNAEGESSEQQFTQYGGDKPVWLLDGTAILYENNGQLWLISNDATDNRPVMIKGRVIFGHEPYVIPQPIP